MFEINFNEFSKLVKKKKTVFLKENRHLSKKKKKKKEKIEKKEKKSKSVNL